MRSQTADRTPDDRGSAGRRALFYRNVVTGNAIGA